MGSIRSLERSARDAAYPWRATREDYAIVKYAALLAAGFPGKIWSKSLHGSNRMADEEHAVVAVFRAGLSLTSARCRWSRMPDLRRVVPVFVLDDGGVKRFGGVRQMIWRLLTPTALGPRERLRQVASPTSKMCWSACNA